MAISGSTVLNMVYDRDIDAKMERTCNRPLPVGLIHEVEAGVLGTGLGILGVGWAFLLSPLYGAVVFTGLFLDVVVYTMWLKRKTAWSIVWGGIAGGMPILAGRALGLGQIDWVGLVLASAVLFWIPTHILTFTLRYKTDYQRCGIPTFPSQYGEQKTQWAIAFSSVAASLTMGIAAYGIGMTWGYMRLLAVLSSGLFFLALTSVIRPSQTLNFGLFKFASLYMLSSMVLLLVETI